MTRLKEKIINMYTLSLMGNHGLNVYFSNEDCKRLYDLLCDYERLKNDSNRVDV